MYGSRLAASVHRKGLEKLIELRRDLPGTSMNSIVRQLLPLCVETSTFSTLTHLC